MLTTCPECALQVSDKALSCPHCGYPMQNSTKKRKPRNKNNKRRRLPNGFGQISEIKNRNLRNPFRAMVTVGKSNDGRPICKPLKPKSYFATYNEAYEALIEYNKNPYDLGPTITVEELFSQWFLEYDKTVAKSRPIENAWKYCTSVYKMRAIDLRARHIKGCIENGVIMIGDEEKHPNPNTKNKIKSLFNQMLDYALEYELVDKNYARTFTLDDETIKEIKSTKKEHIAYTDEEIKKLWNSIWEIPGVDALLIQCYSGWRPQELGLLEIKNIDLEKWTFQGGLKTEAGINRIVPIHPCIQEIVKKKYQEALSIGSPYLLNWIEPGSKKKSTQFTYSRYQHALEQLIEILKLNPNHRPHDGRTHFVTACKHFEVDEYAIKYMVGHSISDITEKVYTKRKFEWLRKEIEKIQK